MIWRFILLFLAYWLLAAHFLRGDHILLCIVIALSPLLAFSKHELIVKALQFCLVLAVFTVWLPSIFSIAEYRIAMDRPWIRMAVIMSAVIIFNFIAAWGISGLLTRRKGK